MSGIEPFEVRKNPVKLVFSEQSSATVSRRVFAEMINAYSDRPGATNEDLDLMRDISIDFSGCRNLYQPEKKPELTGWIDGSLKPVRVGVYERKFWAPFSYWDGHHWHVGSDSVELAAARSFASQSQNSDWRGLVRKP